MTETAYRIKSFVRRKGRITTGQITDYERLSRQFVLEKNNGSVIEQVNDASRRPLNLEIGFGMGDSLAAMSLAHPNENFIGVEVHTPGVARLVRLIDADKIDNLRLYEADAIDVLNHCIPERSLNRVQIYFPDPWHKRKHNKRRLINDDLLDLLFVKLKPQGVIHIATDWEDYALQVVGLINQRRDFRNKSTEQTGYSDKPIWRPETKFERRGIKLGHNVYDILVQVLKN
jgi:tRNA (guanine-N7-)-methyltransferase